MNTNLSGRPRTLLLLAVAIWIGNTPSGVVAQEAKRPPITRTVRYSDLDLTTPAGVQTLYDRIQQAAWVVCGQTLAPHNGPSALDTLRCREALIQAAVKEVNNPSLAKLVAGEQRIRLVSSN